MVELGSCLLSHLGSSPPAFDVQEIVRTGADLPNCGAEEHEYGMDVPIFELCLFKTSCFQSINSYFKKSVVGHLV